MPTDIAFIVPTSIPAALDGLADEGTIALAGGTSVALLLKNRLIEPDRLVYLGRVPELARVELVGDELHLGAMVTLSSLVASPLARTAAPSLVAAASQVGNPRVRSIATIGGAIAHADPRQDIPPVLLALDAYARLLGPEGERTVPAAQFFLGFMETSMAEDELILEVVVPVRPGARSGYKRFTPNAHDDYPVVGVATLLRLDTDGTVADVRVGLGGVDATAILVDQVAALLVGHRPEPELLAAAAAAAARAVEPSDDRRGSADYKRAMTEVWVRRALEDCLSET